MNDSLHEVLYLEKLAMNPKMYDDVVLSKIEWVNQPMYLK